MSLVSPLQTEVIGQDGISYAPVENEQQMTAIREQIAGWNGNPTDEEREEIYKEVGLFEWRTVGEYLDCLERNRTATNVAMLVPQVSHNRRYEPTQGNLRLLACGPYDTVATSEEVERQVELLREAMDQGAIGMSRWVSPLGLELTTAA
jgi:N-acyl-D-amino-acid deacylase